MAPIALGEHVYLRSLLPSDYETVYLLEHASRTRVATYRNRGTSVALESYSQLLWEATLCQFAVCDLEADQMLGLVTCYEPSFRNGTAKLAMLGPPKDSGLSSAMAEAAELLVDYVFTEFDLRKLHADCLESNVAQFGSAVGSVLEVEAHFREQEYVGGRYQDLFVLTLRREAWLSWKDRPRRSTAAVTDPDFPSFAGAVGELLGLDGASLLPETPLDQLELDSLHVLELVELIEGSRTLPADALATCSTLADCHRLFELTHRPSDLSA